MITLKYFFNATQKSINESMLKMDVSLKLGSRFLKMSLNIITLDI